MTRKDFFKELSKITDFSRCGYHYGNGNDEYRSPYWQRRTRSWEFYLCKEKEWVILESGRTGKPILEHRNSIIEKYQKWARQFVKSTKFKY
ncbi:hypothetical protein OHD16_21495 [Sphingobacterium sp. ML3W]|uniref:hypothetical protein n=1 Tax=Sphingobacterium sp. ML3W TaxID=1538644 RepID=UPI00249B4570|nr:hypothetical protein [Sphingobacterium sp. ML3W]WFA77307.1 hypothetical protein OGI71_14635 [Sphingobacterium sp. ML3W]